MDEVDKIIIHSLRQIGCVIDEDALSLNNFTPELLVRAVVACLQEIKPNPALPRSLPASMALRFTVASVLADACTSCGYRSDIGYQTFLYPNAVDVRRLFMFLVEKLPKESATVDDGADIPIGAYEALRAEFKQKMRKQLQAPWVPQYCRVVSNRRHSGCSSRNIKFAPQLNLNVPGSGGSEAQTKEVQVYMQQQAPSVFQQTVAEEYDLICSVMHRNAMDLHCNTLPIDHIKYTIKTAADKSSTSKSVAVASESAAVKIPNEVPAQVAKPDSPLETLSAQVNSLKSQNDELLAARKTHSSTMIALKNQHASIQSNMEQLRRDSKLHERAYVVLENPQANVTKLEGLILSTQDRRKTLEQQWQTYRQPMIENIKTRQATKQSKNLHNVLDLRTVITQLENALREKNANHALLTAELKSATKNVAPRQEYTRRILEFIGNIRKQRSDIFKVLDDTRDLQKQLNSVTAQLHRQFNYTDDLLFQSAKHDMHAKKAYMLLAALHTNCKELVELVMQTGNVSKEIRDLEEQIDREKLKNIATSLKQISDDIRNFENVVKSIQTEIYGVENEITAG